jgi:DNA mismatch endonuclease (patch repair protein)
MRSESAPGDLKVLTKSQQMARVKSKNTGAEVQLRKALWARGMRYRLHATLPGTPDLVFPGARVAVFVDGCFWHGCAEHYSAPQTNSTFWSEKLSRNTERDRRTDLALRQIGWLPLRVWEHELRNIGPLVDQIAEIVWQRRRDLGTHSPRRA